MFGAFFWLFFLKNDIKICVYPKNVVSLQRILNELKFNIR